MAGFVGGLVGGAAITIVIQAVDKFSKVFAGVNKSMLIAGGIITGLGIAGLAASKGFINTAASFETAFTGVRKTVELTESEFEKLRSQFKDLSKEIPVTFEELSSIGEIAGQLGVEGVDNIIKFTKTIADIAVTTNLTSEEAATAFARIANVMDEPISNVDRMGAAIVDLGNNFATSEQEIVNMATRLVGAGKTIGFSTQEIFGMSAALSALGIRSEMGGSAVSRALIVISKAVFAADITFEEFAKTSNLTGDELEAAFEKTTSDVAKFAEVAGISIDEFSKAWKEKPVDAFSKVIIGLKGISDSGGNTFGVLDDLDLKSIRITDTMLRLAGSQDGIQGAVDKSNEAWEENTALTEEAEKRYATTDSQVTILKNKFSSLKDDMGRTLIPAFISLVDILGKVIGWLEKHPTLTKFAIAALAIGSALAIVVGPLLIMVAILPALIAGFGLLSTALAGVAAALLPISLLILGIVAGVVLIKKILDELARRKREKEEDRQNISILDKETGVISLNPTKKERKAAGVVALNDFIITSSGKIIKPNPQDTIIGIKNPKNLGGTTIIVQGDIIGTDPDDIANAFADKMNNVIRLN